TLPRCPPPGSWSLQAILIGVYFAVHLEIHKTPVILESFRVPVAALSAVYVPFKNVFMNQRLPSQEDSTTTRTPFTRHIVAVGDLHGDMKNAQTVLQFSWYYFRADRRGDDTIKLYAWMEQLRVQAAATGGVVLSHLGNHEVMNAIGTRPYVYPSEIQTFGSVAARQKMISTGAIGRAWAMNYTATSRLPLHPHLGPPNTPFPPENHPLYFQKDDDEDEDFYDESQPLSHSALSFVHGGLSPTFSNLAPFPSKINELSSSFLRKLQERRQPPPHPPNPYPGLPAGTTREEVEMYDANGPFWYRGWATDSDEKVCVDVEKVLAKTGTRRMIMGHTPDFNGIVSRCDGKIIIIDTGISHAYGGVLSALSIHYTFTPIGDEEESQRWTEREVVSALYPDRQEIIVDLEREVVGDFRIQ
ncbi:Metallo-dependent phosphatase-like protein, partial [Mycena rebaudengoi]